MPIENDTFIATALGVWATIVTLFMTETFWFNVSWQLQACGLLVAWFAWFTFGLFAWGVHQRRKREREAMRAFVHRFKVVK